MKKEFMDYFEKIGIKSKVLIATIEEAFDSSTSLFQEEVEDVFINNYINKDGTMEYFRLNWYSKNYKSGTVLLSKDIESTFSVIDKRIVHITISKEKYDFKQATKDSRFIITLDYSDRVSSIYKAVGINCDKLQEIFNKYLLPCLSK